MDVIKRAIEIEEEGNILYTSLASKSVNPGLKQIFTMLAEAELKHKKIFENIASGAAISADGGRSIIVEAKDIFKGMGEKMKYVSMENIEVGVYRQALEVEQKSIDIYSDILKKKAVPEDAVKAIVEEEKKHYRLIENIIEFVNRPQSWLENAEWNHLDEY